MISLIRRWLGLDPKAPKKPTQETDEDDAPRKRTNSMFSTDLSYLLAKADMKIPDLIGPKQFAKGFAADGTEITFDEAMVAEGMDSSTLKNAFASNQATIPDILFMWYTNQGFIGYQSCAIVSQHWLINKAMVIPAKDAVRNGYEITANDGEEIDLEVLNALKKIDKKFKLNAALIDFETNKRRFGYRIAIFNVESEDKDYYRKPFNIDSVKPGSYKGITQVDPMWLAPILDQQASANPASMHFYEPTWWQINGKLYHRTHLVIARYADLPDVLKPTYQYGGLPLTQLILERVYAAERTANEAPMLAMTKRLNILKADIASIEANPKAFEERLEQFNQFRNNYGVYVAGLEDDVSQIDTTLTDLDDLIMTQYQLVAAVSEIPATKLMGTSPKGFNATGEHEQESYFNLLENIQTDLSLIVERHHQLAIRSIIEPKFNLQNFVTEIVWYPVNSPSAVELAAINLNKAQTDESLVNAGSIDGNDVRNRIINDPKSGYNGLEAYDIEYEDEPKFPPEAPAAEEPPPTEPPKDPTQAQDEAFGYVCVVPDRLQAMALVNWVAQAGVHMSVHPEDLHITLAHDKTGIPQYSKDDARYTITFTGEVGFLGEGGDEGLVLFVDSPELRARHEALKAMGAMYKFDTYKPHISIKYAPFDDQDLIKIQMAFDKSVFGSMEFGDEQIKKVR